MKRLPKQVRDYLELKFIGELYTTDFILESIIPEKKRAIIKENNKRFKDFCAWEIHMDKNLLLHHEKDCKYCAQQLGERL